MGPHCFQAIRQISGQNDWKKFKYFWFIYSLTNLNLTGCVAISGEGLSLHCSTAQLDDPL